jgi:hypothetical protein
MKPFVITAAQLREARDAIVKELVFEKNRRIEFHVADGTFKIFDDGKLVAETASLGGAAEAFNAIPLRH